MKNNNKVASLQFIDLYVIECTVLSTFLTTQELIGFNIKPFKMESKHFTDGFNKMICERIMKELENDGSMSLLETKLTAWVRDVKTQYQKKMMNLLAANPIPMSVAKKYYEEMKLQYFERLSDGYRY